MGFPPAYLIWCCYCAVKVLAQLVCCMGHAAHNHSSQPYSGMQHRADQPACSLCLIYGMLSGA